MHDLVLIENLNGQTKAVAVSIAQTEVDFAMSHGAKDASNGRRYAEFELEICYFITYEIIDSEGMFMRKQAATRQSDILDVLESTKAPMTAYQILAQLQKDEPDIAPPTVYRALAALTDQGRAHKLESLKSFVPCRCEHDKSLPVLTICDDCGAVEEHDGGTLVAKLSSLIAASDFVPKRHIVELHGHCSACAP